MQQLLDDICKLFRQRLSHLGARILRAHLLQHLHQTVERDGIEIEQIRLSGLHIFKFPPGIIYQRAELADFLLAH